MPASGPAGPARTPPRRKRIDHQGLPLAALLMVEDVDEVLAQADEALYRPRRWGAAG
jgi:hypothetical protein